MKGQGASRFRLLLVSVVTIGTLSTMPAFAAPDCGGLPSHGTLTTLLRSVIAVGDPSVNGGLANDMWATVVNSDGVVCAVTFGLYVKATEKTRKIRG